MGGKKCKKCGKLFVSLKALSGHMKSHSLKYKKKKINKERRLRTIYQYAKCTTNDPLTLCSTSFDNAEQKEEETAAAMGLMMLPNGFANSGGDEMVISTLAKLNDISVHGLGHSDDMDLGKENLSSIGKKKTYKCAVCFKEFGSGQSLGGHQRAHYYKCLVCSEVFGSGEDLEDHKRAHCNVLVYTCSICFKVFGSERLLGDHYRVHYKCVICFKKFRSGEAFENHKRARCKEIQGGHKCKICFKLFASGTALGGHMGIHNKVIKSSKDYRCSLCSKIFGSGEDLEDHKRVSCNVIRNSEVHKCSVCFKEFVTVEDLEDHKRAHCNVLTSSSKVYKCSICFKEFRSRKLLGSHMRVHYKCVLCFKRFKSGKALEDHKRARCKGDHKCLVCFKLFASGTALRGHMRIHSNVITSSKDLYFKCWVCSKEFGTGEDLEDHKRAHCNGITSSKEFGSGPSLGGGHMRIHSNVVTSMGHKCSVCSKEFGSGLSLWGHMSVHSSAMTSSNDNLCFLCFMKFGSVEALEDHERVHHSLITSKDYKCSVCFKEFWSEEALRVHMNVHSSVITTSIVCRNEDIADSFDIRGHVDQLRESQNEYLRWVGTQQWGELGPNSGGNQGTAKLVRIGTVKCILVAVLEHEHPLELVDLQPPKIVDEWEEESDKDDDDLIIEDEFRRPCNRCHQDITVYHRYYYRCTIDSCDYFLHKFCAELPPILNHISDPHPLNLYSDNYYRYQCDICESEISRYEVFYKCSSCDTWIDLKCAVDVEKKSIHHPGHPHLLVCDISKSILCHCNACGKEHKGSFFHCATCPNFTIHSDCAFLPKKLLIQEATDDAFYHPHPLTISYSFPYADQVAKFYPECRVCSRDFAYQRYCWNYKCEKLGTGKTIKNYEDADYPDLIHLPFQDQTCSILKTLFSKKSGPTDFAVKEVNLRDIDHRHQLKLVDTLATSSKIGSLMCHNPMKKFELLCNGCVRPITEMPFYKCSNEEYESCNFALHEWCTRLPASIENHPGHPQHTLLLMPNVPHEIFSIFRCAVCFLPCNGFAYGCVECEYYVDVNCGFIPEKITHKAHPNHLLSRVKVDKYTDCRLCHTSRVEDCFSFSCNICDDVVIHLDCALLLPGTIRHKYDKHPMSLSYFPIENHKSKYFCEICEKELNPHLSFYHCHKCVQSVHSACAPLILRSETDTYSRYTWPASIYDFVNVKFGSIHKTPDHPHPLLFTQGIASDGECNECEEQLRYNMIFKCLKCKYAIDYDCCKRLNSS
ncbi:zinc finger, PHD-type containing protein [Tanacetum coccineum]